MANRTLFEVETVFELEATMRDGTILRADVYRPSGDGPWPVLLARTPYGKRDPGVLARLDPVHAAGRGYLVVIQDCRGRHRSGGRWTPLAHDRDDGYDTVRWAARLPGTSGRVGMYGPSYLGHTQWAAISAQPPELYAAVPEFTWSDPHDGLITRGGAYELGLVTQWTLTLGVNVLERRYFDNSAERHRQLADLEAALDGLVTRTYWELPADAPLRRLELPQPTPDHPSRLPQATIPTLTVAGWFDAFLQGSLDNYIRARNAGAAAALIVGPWSHDNQTGHVGDTDFGAAADASHIDEEDSLLAHELNWLDRHIKQEQEHALPEPPASQPPVLLFVMGSNHWRRFATWPPESIDVPWYLHRGGVLSRDCPEPHSQPDVFDHDPSDPVPTCGGSLLMTAQFPPGPSDQRRIEKRDDVLVYSSEPLTAPLEVVGRVKLHLFATSTTATADWVARLCDVDTGGVSRNINDGILRTADQADDILIDLWSTAHVFLPGHRIRVQIAATCFPRWDRDLSAGRHIVHHDAAQPSRIILPCI